MMRILLRIFLACGLLGTEQSHNLRAQTKTDADCFGPITELAEQRGFKAVSEPYAVLIGSKQLVRGDFSKERGKLTMWQSSLVMIDKGYIVSFTFVGGSEDEIEELIGNLNFAARLS